MNATLALLRPEIERLQAYQPAEYISGLVRLNANETPWRPPGDDTRDGLNRYPDPRPQILADRLASHYGVAPGQLLVTRGSSEAIDLLVRAFCRAGLDEVVICPPTFGMYEVYAAIQGAPVRRMPLRREAGYALPLDALIDEWPVQGKLLFICTPNNPTGNATPIDAIDRLCRALAGRAAVVIDGAYLEFADSDPTHTLLASHENAIVLRTLSKAMGLAGARCGALLGHPALVERIGRLQPPYCFPTPCQEAVLRCLTDEARARFAARRSTLLAERQRLSVALAALPQVAHVWPSDANFLLVDCHDAAAVVDAARAGGVLVRDFSRVPGLPGGVRITVGSPTDNDRLLAALGAP